MTDVFSASKRSEIMSSIHGKDTKPELIVRKMLHGLGYRYRLHDKKLPGNPDLVFSGRRKVIFVHGCYWHRHNCRKGKSFPETREAFWNRKFEDNKRRDLANRRKLRKSGWDVLTIWECQTRPSKQPALARRINRFLDSK